MTTAIYNLKNNPCLTISATTIDYFMKFQMMSERDPSLNLPLFDGQRGTGPAGTLCDIVILKAVRGGLGVKVSV